jgi:arsenite/tail-anchored protein-transporting ATPase
MLAFLEHPTRHLFFTGKGGVGKTSLATATAVALADRGRRVLLVSTDPASNLRQVLEAEVSETTRPVPAVPGLFALNIDPVASAAVYRERVVGPVRGVLPGDAVRQMEEQLSGACTTEIASFDAFTTLLTDPALVEEFDHVIFDTAPTGHTLRLLQLPAAWSAFIEENPEGASCLGPMSGLEAQRSQYAAAVRTLGDSAQTTLVLVTRPEGSALAEAARTGAELAALGIASQRLVVNGVFEATDPSDPLATALESRACAALDAMPAALAALPCELVPLQAHNLVGVAALRALVADEPVPPAPSSEAAPTADLPGLAALVDAVEADGRGLVMVMGKGGVGKTTIAAAVAVELARRGHTVHLSTTDPAAHLADAVDAGVSGLTLSRIDPKEETRRYTEHVLASKGKHLDAEARRLLEEDLRSPCTEEVAVFHAFSKVVREAARGFVVLDTAPTGHTLLLLDQTGAYHREVARNATGLPGRVTTPMMRLQDPSYTKLLIATLPETTPVLEAASLQADLRRAEIEPFAWVVNQSLAAADPADPLLAARARAEAPQLLAVTEEHAARAFLIPMTSYEPVGPDALQALVRGETVLEGTPV